METVEIIVKIKANAEAREKIGSAEVLDLFTEFMKTITDNTPTANGRVYSVYVEGA